MRITIVITLITILSLFQSLEAQSSTTTTTNDTNTNIPKLTVYHESRCPDSRRFFIGQLVPTYLKLGENNINLVSIPFGHARTIQPNNRMVCQHGARECDGNRLMACVQIKGDKNMTNIVQTLGCIFEHDTPKECVEKFMPTINFKETIDNCRVSNESFKLMEEFEKLTGKIGYVPKITLNDEYSEEIQDQCEHNLLECLCKKFKQQQQQQLPEACKQLEKQH